MYKLVRVGCALVMVLLLGLSLSGAQEDTEDREGDPRPEADEIGLEVSVLELIEIYSQFTGRTVTYDSDRFPRKHIVSISQPDFTIKLRNLEELLQIALSELECVMVPVGNFDRIVSSHRAITMAEFVEPSGLEELPQMRFVRTVYPLSHADAETVKNALVSFTSLPGGTVVFVRGVNALIIGDYARNVRSIIKTIDALESEAAPEMKVLTLQNTTFDQLAEAVQAACIIDPNGRVMQPQVGATKDGRRVTVNGRKGEVERVVNVIKQLDQPHE